MNINLYWHKVLSVFTVCVFFAFLITSVISSVKAKSNSAKIDRQAESIKVTNSKGGNEVVTYETKGTEPANYLDKDGNPQKIDTRIEDTSLIQDFLDYLAGFDKKMVKNQFQVFFKDKANAANLISYRYDLRSEGKGMATLDLTPLKLEWVEEEGEKDLISKSNKAIAAPSDF